MSDSKWDFDGPVEMKTPAMDGMALAPNWPLKHAIDLSADSFADCLVDRRSMWTYFGNLATVGLRCVIDLLRESVAVTTMFGKLEGFEYTVVDSPLRRHYHRLNQLKLYDDI